MTLIAELLPGQTVKLDGWTARLGGSFYPEIPLRVYEPEPLMWVWEHLRDREQPVLLDIGASTGSYTLLAAHHKGLRVHAFEPVPLTRRVLERNVALNKLEKRVEVHEFALSDHDGSDTFYVVDPPSQSALSMLGGQPHVYKQAHGIIVPLTTVDAFCAAFKVVPTLIKIDTEGGELAVLRGAFKTVTNHHPLILCEYSIENAAQYGYHPNTLIHVLESVGYTVNKGDNDLYAEFGGQDSRDSV